MRKNVTRLRNSALLHGLWFTLASALVLPGAARATWGNENWGTMVWGQGASPPVLLALGIVGLTLLAMGLAARQPGPCVSGEPRSD